MKQKKNKILIIVIVILVIIGISLVSLGFLYLKTDFLKSNKQLFIKYVAQTLDKEEGIINTELINYYEKQKSTPYTNKGNISANIEPSEDNTGLLKTINNMNIEFSGKSDRASSNIIQDIKVNYSDSVNFPLSFKSTKDEMGIQTKYVGSKYITINKEGLENISSSSNLGKLAVVMKKMENVLSMDLNLSDELQHIKDTYIEILNQNVQDTNFSEVSEDGKKGYKLSLSNNELNNVLIKLLETLKEDQTTIDKLNEFIDVQGSLKEITISDIDNLINSINDEISKNSEAEQENIEVVVYQENGKTKKITVKVGEMNVAIEKIEETGNLQYNISVEDIEDEKSKYRISFSVKYDGLASAQNIQEDYELLIETSLNTAVLSGVTDTSSGTISYKYNISNNINFEEASDIKDFTENDSLNLNNLEEGQLTNFMNNLEQRLVAVNKIQMEGVGLSEDSYPITYMMPDTMALQVMMYDTANNVINHSLLNSDELDQAEITTFNAKFELYQGTNLGGGTVKGLLTTISVNNGLDEDDENSEGSKKNNTNEIKKIKEINFNGEEYEVNKQTIALLKEEISTEDHFKVEFERDADSGRIYRVVINKK